MELISENFWKSFGCSISNAAETNSNSGTDTKFDADSPRFRDRHQIQFGVCPEFSLGVVCTCVTESLHSPSISRRSPNFRRQKTWVPYNELPCNLSFRFGTCISPMENLKRSAALISPCRKVKCLACSGQTEPARRRL